ncbi:facilitated trehalose transporter Tret1-like [Sitophilus oryzae]|uniref:Facilitated trehalose transporter Tret1-like n=1 Tax=Sitophilus oryzae TaxID=7048 RepID=A0A6J2YE81_SITOR|nr:facilitated trehalose transporter Tret1-like [Sitophilus oryzae]
MAEQRQNYKYESVAGQEGGDVEKYRVHDEEVQVTVMQQQKPSTSRTFQYIAACTANLAGFTCGITLGWTSPVLPKLETLQDNPLGAIVSADDSGWIGSLLPLGAALGPFLAGALSDKIGRKRTLLYGNLPFIVGLVLNIMATSVNYFLLSRFLCGIAVGLTFTVLPMYVGEIAEDEIRGALGTLLQLFTTLGLLFSFGVGPYTTFTTFNVACLVVPVVFLVTFFLFIPESPYFLLQAGNEDEAEAALMKLRSTTEVQDVKRELDDMKSSVADALANKSSFGDIFKNKGLTRAYILANGLLVFQQVSGINIVLFFAQSIFQDAGVALAPEICTIAIGTVQVVASGASSVLIDRSGKRFLLMLSALGMAVSQMVLAYFFHLKDDKGEDVTSLSWLPICCLVGYIITYCLGFGPIPWAVMGEMFPANVKSVASTATAATCWFFGFLITKYFGIVAALIGKSGSFGVFGVCCVVGFVFVYKFLPETSGKSLQEIQDILNGRSTTKDVEEEKN